MTPRVAHSSSIRWGRTELLAALLLLTVVVYWPGLSGAFMFDDAAHVKDNAVVAIQDLSPSSLLQAWNSSPFKFPHSRPLAMLSFGISHALAGMDPFWFKVGNLLVHLLCGVAVFVLVRLIGVVYERTRAEIPPGPPLSKGGENKTWEWTALLVTALWLLQPLNLSPVLYIVQRMTSLSTLFVLLGLIGYLAGRRRMLEGRNGLGLILAGLLVCGPLAFLAKENGILLPGFLFVLELTLFRFRAPGRRDRRFLHGFFAVTIGLPIAVGAVYLIQHPGWLSGGYGTREFTLEERVLTEARVIWFYIQMLFVPDNAALGFYHDDIRISKSLFDPPTTWLAIMGLAALLLVSLLALRRAPMLAFAILFFLIGHSIESTVFPLELVYEHRNYLPSLGPLLALGYYLTAAPFARRFRLAHGSVAIMFVVLFATTTALRAQTWGNETVFYLAEAQHHPDSPRANFRVGQMLISALPSSKDPARLYRLARYHMGRAVALNPRNSDGLFGLIVLNLHAGVPVPKAWLDELKHRLEFVPFSPEHVTTSQFSYLVRWHMADPKARLSKEDMLGIFDAVLRNPTLDKYGKAGILSALRAYYQHVLKEPETALGYARQAARTWPERWSYQDRLVRLLAATGRQTEAYQALDHAAEFDPEGIHAAEAAALRALIADTTTKADGNSPPPTTMDDQ